MSDDIASFVAEMFGHQPKDVALFETAVTHSSRRGCNYERLEFLGDRVLGVVIASWLYDRFPDEPEGNLSRRFNTLVDRGTCGTIGREIGLPAVVRLGKQALGDGADTSENVLGDVVEALIGAIFIEGGLQSAEASIRALWAPLIEEQRRAPRHPKSELQELAAAHDVPNPNYEVVGRTGPHHQPRFTVRVSVETIGEAEAEGTSKQDAETEAAKALLQKLK